MSARPLDQAQMRQRISEGLLEAEHCDAYDAEADDLNPDLGPCEGLPDCDQCRVIAVEAIMRALQRP